MEVALLFSMVIGLMLIGVPIAISLGMSSVLFLLVYSDSSLASVAQTLFSAFEGHYTLLAIPFFILASSFMTTGGVAQRIIRFSIACVGHLPGGLAIAGVFACMLFAALSGSSPATVVAIGTIVIGGMRQVGYTKDFAAGVICTAGTLGILIPPSIVMVVYAASVEVSVGRMFLAGVIPGLLAGFMLMTTIYVIARIKNLPKGEWQGWGEIVASGREAGWGLFLIVIILGGIYGGIFTPTEAAAVAAVYAFFIATFVYKDMGPLADRQPRSLSAAAVNETPGSIPLRSRPWAIVTAFFHPDTQRTLFDAGKLTVTLLFVIANALILKHVLTDEQIPQHIANAMLSAGFGPVMFLIVVNIILLIGGQFMEPSGYCQIRSWGQKSSRTRCSNASKKRRCQFWHRRFSSNFCETELSVFAKRSSHSYKLQHWSIWAHLRPSLRLVLMSASPAPAKPARAAMCEVSALSGFATVGAFGDTSALHKQ